MHHHRQGREASSSRFVQGVTQQPLQLSASASGRRAMRLRQTVDTPQTPAQRRRFIGLRPTYTALLLHVAHAAITTTHRTLLFFYWFRPSRRGCHQARSGSSRDWRIWFNRSISFGKDAAAPHLGFPLQPMLAQFSQHPWTLGMMTVFSLVPGIGQQQYLSTCLRRAGSLILFPGPVHPQAIPHSLKNARRTQRVVPIVAHHELLGRRPIHTPQTGGQALSFGTG